MQCQDAWKYSLVSSQTTHQQPVLFVVKAVPPPAYNWFLFWQQMDNAVYTFEQLLHQSYEAKGEDDLCKTIQRCQDRVLKVKQTN